MASGETSRKDGKKVAYDEKTIQTLDALEHIRLRTGMYIGRRGNGSHPLDGIYVMLKEVIDKRRTLFDNQLVKALINIVSIFPLGSPGQTEQQRDRPGDRHQPSAPHPSKGGDPARLARPVPQTAPAAGVGGRADGLYRQPGHRRRYTKKNNAREGMHAR